MISIGIDVHKKKCTATLKRDSKRIVEQTSFCNNNYGINEFIQHIKGCYKEDAIAVCESTGNYWIRLHDTLEDNGINTLLANSLKSIDPKDKYAFVGIGNALDSLGKHTQAI